MRASDARLRSELDRYRSSRGTRDGELHVFVCVCVSGVCVCVSVDRFRSSRGTRDGGLLVFVCVCVQTSLCVCVFACVCCVRMCLCFHTHNPA